MKAPADLLDLWGRNALVTGSSRGIGAAIAKGLAAAGADVAVHCAGRMDKASEVSGWIKELGRRASVIQADLGDEAGPKTLFIEAERALERVDILILNASLQYRRDWTQFVREEVDEVLTVNVRSSYELMTLAMPRMRAAGWGRIITIGSVQQARPSPMFAPYAASKLAQLGLVRTLAPQVAADGVTLNNLAPGVIETDRNTQALADAGYREKVRTQVPAGRFGTPEDCVGAALLLCSDAGAYITGTDFFVDGGMALSARPENTANQQACYE